MSCSRPRPFRTSSFVNHSSFVIRHSLHLAGLTSAPGFPYFPARFQGPRIRFF